MLPERPPPTSTTPSVASPRSSRPARARTELDYNTQGTWQVTSGQWDATGLLKDEKYKYDGIGRLREVTRSMPDGTRAKRRIRYHGNSKKSLETEFQPASASAQWTKYDNYDPFGRVGRIIPPDHDDDDEDKNFMTTITYNGIGGETRQWRFRGHGRQPQGGFELSSNQSFGKSDQGSRNESRRRR